MKIAVFGHDANHEKWQRRMRAFKELGHDAYGLMMRRGEDAPRPWPNLDLGESVDGHFVNRGMAVLRGLKRAHRHEFLDGADLIWARNLDMLAVAIGARGRKKTPVLYETLDIHHALTGGIESQVMRGAEGKLLGQVSRILVSSPAYETEYYDRHHPEHPPISVIENRLPVADLPPRPTLPGSEPSEADTSGPIIIGWVGVLRCARSLAALDAATKAAAGKVQIHLHGKPASAEIPNFDTIVQSNPHLIDHGAFSGLADLGRVYGSLDAVWAGDFMQARGNSDWLLPNRLYEGGYFGVPAIAPAQTQTATWIEEKGTGLVIGPEIEKTLPELVCKPSLRHDLSALRSSILTLPASLFAGGHDELAKCIEEATCQTAH